MANRKIKAKTKKNAYRAAQYGSFAMEFVSVMAPYIILGIVNFDEWFTQESGWKVGLGGSLGMALAGIAIFLVTKKQADDAKRQAGENPSSAVVSYEWITLILGWFMALFILTLIESILSQITSIMFWGGVGLLGGLGFNITSVEMKKRADAYKAAFTKIKQKTLEEEVEKEVRGESGNYDPID